jgi:hypothetical protein
MEDRHDFHVLYVTMNKSLPHDLSDEPSAFFRFHFLLFFLDKHRAMIIMGQLKNRFPHHISPQKEEPKNEKTVAAAGCRDVDRRLYFRVLQTQLSLRQQFACVLQLVGIQEYHG